MKAVAAVDLGATSGRVILGSVSHDELRLRHVARFPNQPVRTHEGASSALHWNILELYRSLTAGLASALREEPETVSIGVDSWAVDYALLREGRMLGAPYHYRDERTVRGVADVHARIDADELYRRNGLQHLPFNTLFQLASERDVLALADQALLVPDLIGYWLTGIAATEITNASTTGLLSPHTRAWDEDLLTRLDLPRGILAPLIEPGTRLGTLLPSVAADLGAPESLGVVAVGSHDTASAVVAVPTTGDHVAYISSGTWSLVGVELERPVVSPEGRAAGFTNEGGVDGRVRFLKNVSGLWLLSESIRTWEKQTGERIELPLLLAEAAAIRGRITVFDAADERFVAPGNIPGRIVEWCVERGLEQPRSRAEFVRSILESLAEAYATTLEQASALSGTPIDTVHIVGGGSQNELLCRLTADRTGRTVLAGPVEATAIGNILVQARAQGLASGSLESLRSLVLRAFPPVRYDPRPSSSEKG
ncbi:rhamnulokinase family protein [Rathayibacter sp. VKM Ac-2801]|uniref:rhamnulokinase n=1 Tax=Rathayibacter sp. VKM Ac-2801 TaxID=2609255 RepID=UPI0013202729|nr:rhamnulokinase family protein [Rathayibacter sp. VKM Ac-2801]QHC69260.1 rhamnulokinase [Rathayibacter sp. VKM Ac-2801]